MAGFGSKVPEEKWEEYNTHRESQGLERLALQPGIKLIDPSKAQHGTWKYEHMEAPVTELLNVLNFCYPQFHHVIEVDHSMNHLKGKDDALATTGLSVGYGGDQRHMRDTVLTAEDIGPHPALFTYVNAANVEVTVDRKLKVGATQSWLF